MSHTHQIVQAAVILANASLAERLKTHPRKRPFSWGHPVPYSGGSVRVYLKREGDLYSGCFICLSRLNVMTMSWNDENGGQPVRTRGEVTIKFVVNQLLDIQLHDEV
jgi:hypothetical protein